MKDFLRKIWNWIVSQLYKVPFDKYLHFIAGLVIAAFFALAIRHGWEKLCIFPAVFFGVAKEFFDIWTTGEMDWKDLLATAIGGIVPLIFVWLNLWWF